jgi:hypothetical protein
MSLGFLLNLAEEIHADVARLGERTGDGETVPSLGLSFQIELENADARARFLEELQQTFQGLAKKYAVEDSTKGQGFQVSLVCYPRPAASAELRPAWPEPAGRRPERRTE